MWHYMHSSCKPTLVWSTSDHVRSFWKGRLNKKEVADRKAKRNPQQQPAPTRSYFDASGSKRFQGTSSLKGTGSDAELIR